MKKNLICMLMALLCTFVLGSTAILSYGCTDDDASSSSSSQQFEDEEWTKPY